MDAYGLRWLLLTWSGVLMAASLPEDVIAEIQAIYLAVGDMTPLLIGERHLPEIDCTPRVVFVLTLDGGNIGPVPKIGAGYVAGITETIKCYVWGAETVEDVERYREAHLITIRILNCFKRTTPGRLTGKVYKRDKASEQTYGENYQLTVSYTWGVPTDDAIFRVTSETPGAQPPSPDQPNGSTGANFDVVPILAEPTR